MRNLAKVVISHGDILPRFPTLSRKTYSIFVVKIPKWSTEMNSRQSQPLYSSICKTMGFEHTLTIRLLNANLIQHLPTIREERGVREREVEREKREVSLRTLCKYCCVPNMNHSAEE